MPAPTCQRGIALITALLYLLVITLLVTSAASSGLLQTKISQHLGQEEQAFENAESALLAGESAIEHSVEESDQGEGVINADASYRFAKISRPECGLYYQIDATGITATATRRLQSWLVLPAVGKNPCTDTASSPHRVAWRELNE